MGYKTGTQSQPVKSAFQKGAVILGRCARIQLQARPNWDVGGFKQEAWVSKETNFRAFNNYLRNTGKIKMFILIKWS